jgi:hypothetical protein
MEKTAKVELGEREDSFAFLKLAALFVMILVLDVVMEYC